MLFRTPLLARLSVLNALSGACGCGDHHRGACRDAYHDDYALSVLRLNPKVLQPNFYDGLYGLYSYDHGGDVHGCDRFPNV